VIHPALLTSATDRQDLNRALLEIAEVLRGAFHEAPFELWIRDLDGRVILQNAAATKWGEPHGASVDDSNVPPEVVADWRANNARAYAGETVQNEIEYVLGGERRHYHVVVVPIRRNSTVHGILGFNIDLTDRKRAEEDLREVDRRRSEFLSVLSHELRNPLAAIRTSTHVLTSVGSDSPEGSRALAVIDRQTTHLARLVDDLLDITRISSGKIRLQVEDLDLTELVRCTVDDYRSVLATAALAVTLPDTAMWVRGDATRLSEVVGNLLSNAAKFTPPSGRITVSLTRRAQRAVLQIADTGMGIDAPTLGRLFVPFLQADRSVDRSHGGLGLGLVVVKSLVEMHHGVVTAHSDGPGRGARFTVELPIVEIASPPRATATLSAQREGGSRRVLVIEDNADAAEVLLDAFRLAGHEVSLAIDGPSGLKLARELAPDVVLCDIGLPGPLDGYAIAQRLQADPALAGAFRIALTGYAQPDDQSRALDAGFHAHYAKPPDLTALLHVIERVPRAARRDK
jgi:PAS domain S-box-containing protein